MELVYYVLPYLLFWLTTPGRAEVYPSAGFPPVLGQRFTDQPWIVSFQSLYLFFFSSLLEVLVVKRLLSLLEEM